MDLNDVETVNFNALGGTDTVTVNDLSGTDVTQVNVNLAGTLGGTTGDAAGGHRDRERNERRTTSSTSWAPGRPLRSSACRPSVNITGSEGANDALVVNGAAAATTASSAATLPAGVIEPHP